jgi:hypothetical protein
MTINITRRAAMAGALALSAALAVPSIASIDKPANWRDLPEQIAEQMRALGALLALYNRGQFRAIVDPGHDGGWLQSTMARQLSPAAVAAAIEWRDAQGKAIAMFDAVAPKDHPGPFTRPSGLNYGPSWDTYWNANVQARDAFDRMIAAICEGAPAWRNWG